MMYLRKEAQITEESFQGSGGAVLAAMPCASQAFFLTRFIG